MILLKVLLIEGKDYENRRQNECASVNKGITSTNRRHFLLQCVYSKSNSLDAIKRKIRGKIAITS